MGKAMRGFLKGAMQFLIWRNPMFRLFCMVGLLWLGGKAASDYTYLPLDDVQGIITSGEFVIEDWETGERYEGTMRSAYTECCTYLRIEVGGETAFILHDLEAVYSEAWQGSEPLQRINATTPFLNLEESLISPFHGFRLLHRIEEEKEARFEDREREQTLTGQDSKLIEYLFVAKTFPDGRAFYTEHKLELSGDFLQSAQLNVIASDGFVMPTYHAQYSDLHERLNLPTKAEVDLFTVKADDEVALVKTVEVQITQLAELPPNKTKAELMAAFSQGLERIETAVNRRKIENTSPAMRSAKVWGSVTPWLLASGGFLLVFSFGYYIFKAARNG